MAASLVTADGVGKFTEPIAADGRERIGGEAQDALAPGRINGETRGTLPLLAAPGIRTRSPDADDPLSRLLRTGHEPPPGGWIRFLAGKACLPCRPGTTGIQYDAGVRGSATGAVCGITRDIEPNTPTAPANHSSRKSRIRKAWSITAACHSAILSG
jgi:hypothetical protein